MARVDPAAAVAGGPDASAAIASDRARPRRVRHRRVHYCCGFDPRGARWYHRLFRGEAAVAARVNGCAFAVGELDRQAGVGSWTIDADWGEAGPVRTSYRVAEVVDIVEAWWRKPALAAAVGRVRAAAYVVVSGLLVRVAACAPGYALAFVLAVGGWAVQLALAISALVALGVAAWLLANGDLRGWWLLVAAGVIVGAASAYRIIARRFHSPWVRRATAFADALARGAIPELEQRLAAVADRIAVDLADEEVDEVLLVGHSYGTLLVPMVAARLPGSAARRLSLLTVGTCIEHLALDRRAAAFRTAVAAAAARCACWRNVVAPPDGACFPRARFAQLCGVEPSLPGYPRSVSPRFHRIYPPERYRSLKRDKFELHFLYVKAAELAGGYDYFRITCGPDPLAVAIPIEGDQDGR